MGETAQASQFRTIFAAVFAAGIALLVVVAVLVSYGDRAAKSKAADDYKMSQIGVAWGKCNGTVGAAYRTAHRLPYGGTDEVGLEGVINRCLVDTYGYSPKDIPAGEAIEGIRQHCYAVRC